MNEVSDSSNTSAPETSVTGVRLAPTAQLRLLSQQDASSGSDLFHDRILTASSTDGGRIFPLRDDGGDSTIALRAATPGATELRIADDGMSSGMSSLGTALGTAQDRGLTTDSSASHLGDMLQSDPVASQQASTSTSPADRSMAANDALEPPAPAPWHDAGSGGHRNSALSGGTDQNNDAGSAGALDQSQHGDHRISSALDVLPLDSIIDPAQRHDSTAGDHHNAAADDAQPAHGSRHQSDPLPSLVPSGHADAGHTGAADADAPSAHADVSKIDDTSKPAGNAGHVSADHNEVASFGTDGSASDDTTIHQAQTVPPSTGALVEAGTKAILLATDESPNRIGPHASAADFVLGTAPSQIHSAAHAAAAFSPGVLGARDQLASAIATATPEAAAMTTLPPSPITGAAIPTLGGDMHALQKHAA